VSCRRRRVRALWFGPLALIGATVVPAAHAAAGPASFSIRPGHYNAGDPASRAYFKRTVAPGASFTDDVVVSNGGSTPVTLLVYPVDGLTGQTSGSVYANRDAPRRETGAWVRVAADRITVAPGTQTTVGFTTRVPAGASPGDHLAGIAFEDTNVATSTGRFQVRQVLREVVGVLVRVPGPAQPRLQLGRLSLKTLAGTQLGSVVVEIGNSGRLLCKPRLSVNLAAPKLRETIGRQLDTILPGDTIAYPLVLRHGLGRATYAVHARAACPQTTATTDARIRLGSPLAGTGDRPPATAATVVRVGSTGMATWMVAGLASLTAIAGAGIGCMLRLRRSKP
jgi:hypothetical protein